MSRRTDSWKNAERHHCKYCNVWMASDRISIQIHENGKKHREAVEESLRKRRDDKLKEEREKDVMEKSLKMMEEAAARAHVADVQSGAFYQSVSCTVVNGAATSFPNMGQQPIPGVDEKIKDNKSKSEMNSWKVRKQKRGDDRASSQKEDVEDLDEIKRKKRRIMIDRYKNLEPDEGHYTIDKSTFLQGDIYISIMEEEMPVQIWTGSITTTKEYRKSDDPTVQALWKHGIILKVDKTSDDIDKTLCSVSYLKNLDDEDETIEKKVSADRLRLILGSDELIPSTIEEARLSLLGGEETILQNGSGVNGSVATPEIDDNTGLSSWGTVSIKKVTVSQEVKEERARARAKRREQFNKEQMKEKEAQARKMEEERHSNTHDSALGAFDVWSTTEGKAGYKGVQIHQNEDVSQNIQLAKGKVDVKFKKKGSDKKSMFKRAKKKQNRRKTFADDDDE